MPHEDSSPRRRRTRQAGRRPRRRALLFETEISWFVLVGALDVFMTYIILRFSHDGQTRHTLVESNPVAAWVLHRWGMRGMVIFKFIMIAVVVTIAEVVGQVRPVVARLLLLGGTLVVGSVVVYSLLLLLRSL